MSEDAKPAGREPAFNFPTVIAATAAALIAIHGVRELVLTPWGDNAVLAWFAFIPGRYIGGGELLSVSGWPAKAWSFVTYALLHGDAVHLMVNILWMAVFGSALARRFGSGRFLAFSALCAIAGAALHLVFFWGEMIPVVGASAAISGHMAAVARFGFSPGGPLDRSRLALGRTPWTVAALSIGDTLRDRRAMIFLAIWFAFNLVVGLGSGMVFGGGVTIAWQAHIGGFAAGLLLFDLLDPAGRRHANGPRPGRGRSGHLP